MDLIKTIALKLDLPINKVDNTVLLLQDQNSIPFISRYRKEITGNLNEVQILKIKEEFARLEALEKRRETVLQSIESQGCLTDTLRYQILLADTLTHLEDIYQPYRPKRRTRAMNAREMGLEPLAALIVDQIKSHQDIQTLTYPYINDSVPNIQSAIDGASDIVAEWINENAIIRQSVRDKGFKSGKIISEKRLETFDDRKVFEIYYQFELPVKYLKPHQVLAINRGEKENVLSVKVHINENDWQNAIHSQFPTDRNSVFYDTLIDASEDSARRLLLPSIERDIRRMVSEQSEHHAIEVFARNLRSLLSQPPLSGHVILAIDPGFRTGSKIAVVDRTGKLITTATIYPHPPQKKQSEAYKTIEALIKQHKITLIVIGNGTASRETESFIAKLTKNDSTVNYLITSEAGASVYSASELARKEFPDLDVSIRGAVSIARRVQDPLAELVKIDPKAIGVGMYQHDVNQTRLSETLDRVVGSVVNSIGVEVNTASAALLKHVAGIGSTMAEKIVHYREKNGPFTCRNQIQDVPGMGPKTYEQSIGFMRIQNSKNPLDATSIHPESYPIASQLFDRIGLSSDANSQERINAVQKFREQTHLDELAENLNSGLITVNDILEEIARPGRDPREDLPKPLLRKDVLSVSDLSPGMELLGTIRNVVDFGAFIDIGVKTDGLLHRSKIAEGTHLQVGDIINISILSVDQERHRISLDMKERTQS